MLVDPFGDLSVRAMMHPGYLNPDYVSESGPTDKELTLFALKDKKSGKLLCVFGNYSMHYFSGNPGFSADYFGEVAQIVEEKIIKEGIGIESDFLAILSQGTSGDLYWVDYSKPKISQSRTEYSMGLSKKIFGLLNTLKYHSDIPFGMTERRIRISRRLPDKKRLDWAKKLNQSRGDITPRNRPEVYAQASQWINNNPESEVVLQTIRMGDFIMTAMPNEVYAITGLKLKKQSPAKVTMNVELSNGAEGYIPPPEQHLLGGYTTWPARTAALKESAEPVIVENLLEMIEKLTGQKRKSNILKTSKFRSAILSKKPIAYWPLDDLSVTETMDLTENHTSKYQGSVALHLNGIKRNGLDDSNKCVYFAGGSFVSELKNPLEEFSISLFFWSANAPIPKGHEQIVSAVGVPVGAEVEERGVAARGDFFGLGSR